MLTVPAVARIADATVYADDVYFHRFAAIPDEPRVRLDEAGDPVFLFVKYANADANVGETTDPRLPKGGGFLVFDTVLACTSEQEAAVRSQLQARVDAEWARLRTGTPEEQGRPGVSGTTAPPSVELVAPTWLEGTAKLDTTQASGLVSSRLAAGKASLVGANGSTFNLDLTAEGATFLQATLLQGATPAASNLAPLQVSYEATFQARLPPVHISVKVDTERLHEYTKKYVQGRGWHWCTSYDLEHSEFDSETLQASGAVRVIIDNSSGLDEAVLNELRRFALDMVKTMAQDLFARKTKEAAEPKDREMGPNQTFELKELDRQSMSLDFQLEQRDVVPWPVAPRATIETLFSGRSDTEMRKFVRQVDLTDPFFQHLNVDIDVRAPFGDAVDNVQVELLYEGLDENGVGRSKGETFTFTETERGRQRWAPSLIGTEREYRWRSKVTYVGGDQGVWTGWQRSQSNSLVVDAQDRGELRVTVDAFDVDFERHVDNVQVAISYGDPDGGVPNETEVVVLTSTMRHDEYFRKLFRPKRQEAFYATRFKLRSGDVVEPGPAQPVRGSQIVINQPTADLMTVRLLPSGDGWDQALSVVVELEHSDPQTGLVQDGSFTLTKPDQSETWVVHLRKGEPRDFRYRTLTRLKGGGARRSEWSAVSPGGSQAVLIPVEKEGYDLILSGKLLNSQLSAVTEVTIDYEVGGVRRSQTFAFTAPDTQICHLEIPRTEPLAYRATVTYNLADGDPVTKAGISGADTVFTVPPLLARDLGRADVTVFAGMIDYRATPLVVVDIEPSGAGPTISLNFTDATKTKEVMLPTVDGKLTYRNRVTYFDAAGQSSEGDWVTSNTPRIVIPRLAR
jgi:hypothetical protein